MQLPYDEYRSFYDELGIGEAEGRKHFEHLVDILICFARHFFGEPQAANGLGISLDFDSITGSGRVESRVKLLPSFNRTANDKAGRNGP